MTDADEFPRKQVATSRIENHGVRVAIFDVSGRLFGIALGDVREILPLPKLSHPPHSPEIVAGIMDLGGTAVVVGDTAAILGMGRSDPGPYWSIIQLRRRDHPAALLVNRVERVALIEASEIRPVSHDDTLNGCVSGEFTNRDTVVHLLDVDRLLFEKERQALDEYRAREERRLDGLVAEAGK